MAANEPGLQTHANAQWYRVINTIEAVMPEK
jgi:hypothetical protein